MFIILCLLAIVGVFSDTECPYTTNAILDRRSDNTTLRFVQYNAEWLFVDYYAEFGCPGESCTWVNVSEAEKHLGYVADVIGELSPDIINLCEVEGCHELGMLLDVLPETYDPFLIKGTDTSTGQNVGMLSKITPSVPLYRTEDRASYPLKGSQCGYTGSDGSVGVSKHYISEFYLGDYRVAVIGAHLLAYPDDVGRCVQREAQAQVLQRVVLDKILSGFEILLIGDFNDFDAAVLDKNDNKPISQVLDILKGQFGEHAGQYELYSVAEKMAKSERFSDWYDRNVDCISESTEFSLIDYVLATPRLFDHISQVFIYHGYDEFCGKYNSDHYPVVVDFLLNSSNNI
jgi:exonuclease III